MTLTDTDTLYIKLYLERNYHLTSEKSINAAIGIVANENNYHPIRDKLNSLVWDGTERIRYALRHFLGADTSDLTYECLKTFIENTHIGHLSIEESCFHSLSKSRTS